MVYIIFHKEFTESVNLLQCKRGVSFAEKAYHIFNHPEYFLDFKYMEAMMVISTFV